jgi:hypothetical protein
MDALRLQFETRHAPEKRFHFRFVCLALPREFRLHSSNLGFALLHWLFQRRETQ